MLSSIHGRKPKHPRSPSRSPSRTSSKRSKSKPRRSRSPRSEVPIVETRSAVMAHTIVAKPQNKIFIAVFRGRDTKGECDKTYEDVLIKHFKAEITGFYGIEDHRIESRCMSPPEFPNKEWASYTPAEGETEKETQRADRYTDELQTHASEEMSWVHDRVTDGWIGVVVGISNGSIPASHLAILYPDSIPVLTLVSTVPTPEQVEKMQKMLQLRVIMSICSNESYFGGRLGLRKVSEALYSDVLTAAGGHCKETPFDMLMLGRLTAHKLGGSEQIKKHFSNWQTPENTVRPERGWHSEQTWRPAQTWGYA